MVVLRPLLVDSILCVVSSTPAFSLQSHQAMHEVGGGYTHDPALDGMSSEIASALQPKYMWVNAPQC